MRQRSSSTCTRNPATSYRHQSGTPSGVMTGRGVSVSALELREVTKRYVGHLAVDRLSLAVPPGTIYGILGPNGAGKSTTLRMTMNIIARDSGSIAVLGTDPAIDGTVLRRVGYLPEERGLYKKMTALDVIVFFGELRGMQ